MLTDDDAQKRIEVACWRMVRAMMRPNDDYDVVTALAGLDVDDIEAVVWHLRGFATAALTQADGDRAAASGGD